MLFPLSLGLRTPWTCQDSEVVPSWFLSLPVGTWVAGHRHPRIHPQVLTFHASRFSSCTAAVAPVSPPSSGWGPPCSLSVNTVPTWLSQTASSLWQQTLERKPSRSQKVASSTHKSFLVGVLQCCLLHLVHMATEQRSVAWLGIHQLLMWKRGGEEHGYSRCYVSSGYSLLLAPLLTHTCMDMDMNVHMGMIMNWTWTWMWKTIRPWTWSVTRSMNINMNMNMYCRRALT